MRIRSVKFSKDIGKDVDMVHVTCDVHLPCPKIPFTSGLSACTVKLEHFKGNMGMSRRGAYFCMSAHCT